MQTKSNYLSTIKAQNPTGMNYKLQMQGKKKPDNTISCIHKIKNAMQKIKN